jgi:hypothetical protein
LNLLIDIKMILIRHGFVPRRPERSPTAPFSYRRIETADLLAKLSADPNSGAGRVLDRAAIAAMGGAPDADLFDDAKPGFEIGSNLTGPLLTDSPIKGAHGYFPDHPEMRATLIIDGAGQTGSLGEVDMRDIAPRWRRSSASRCRARTGNRCWRSASPNGAHFGEGRDQIVRRTLGRGWKSFLSGEAACP